MGVVGVGDRGGEAGQVGFDGGIARQELLLIGVEVGEVLLQDKDAFPAIVPRQGRDDLGLRCAAPVVSVPCEMRPDRGDRRRYRGGSSNPVTPVMSLTTSGSWTFICTNAFCIRCTRALVDSISVARCRR